MLSIHQKIRSKIHYIILRGKEIIIDSYSFIKGNYYNFSIKNTKIGIIFIHNTLLKLYPNEYYINISGLIITNNYTFKVKITDLDLVFYKNLFYTININYKYYVNKKQ